MLPASKVQKLSHLKGTGDAACSSYQRSILLEVQVRAKQLTVVSSVVKKLASETGSRLRISVLLVILFLQPHLARILYPFEYLCVFLPSSACHYGTIREIPPAQLCAPDYKLMHINRNKRAVSTSNKHIKTRPHVWA